MDSLEFIYDNEPIKISYWKYNAYLTDDYNHQELCIPTQRLCQAIEVLKNILNYMEENNLSSVNLDNDCGEIEIDFDDEAEEYYWCSEIMDYDDINPYFTVNSGFYGNNIYKSRLGYIIQSLENLQDIIDCKTIDESCIDNLTLKYILKYNIKQKERKYEE